MTPRLLCIDDLKYLWDTKAGENEKAGVKNLFELDLDGFKDMLVRMAIFTYHKPGLKKMIVIVDGFVPKNIKLLESFCTYIHLHDIDFIHNYMRLQVKQKAAWEGVGDKNGKEWMDIVRLVHCLTSLINALNLISVSHCNILIIITHYTLTIGTKLVKSIPKSTTDN